MPFKEYIIMQENRAYYQTMVLKILENVLEEIKLEIPADFTEGFLLFVQFQSSDSNFCEGLLKPSIF
jgi:hypothetical protein